MDEVEYIVEIPIDALKEVSQRLLDHLGEIEGESVRVERDYFWSVPRDLRTNVYAEPGSLTVGQVSECWSNLNRLRSNDSPELTFALVWLGEVFRSIGDEIVAP